MATAEVSAVITATRQRMLSRKEAARYLGVSYGTLSRWACERTGPAFVKLGPSNASVRYPIEVLDEFVAASMKHPKGGA